MTQLGVFIYDKHFWRPNSLLVSTNYLSAPEDISVGIDS